MSATIGEIVTANPPRCIAAFRQGPGRAEQDAHTTYVTFDLACPQCGNEAFSLDEEMASNGWTRAVGVTCRHCFNRLGLFNTPEHGYDGELGHSAPSGGPFQVQAMSDYKGQPLSSETLRVIFTFNIDLAELQEIGAENKIAVQDLFDWFTVMDGDKFLWDWECA